MAGSIIKNIKSTKCGWESKTLNDHSHKGLMKCLYRSNVELFRANQTIQAQDRANKDLQAELAKYLVKEQTEKENTGLMDVTKPIELTTAVKDDKKLASDLLEAESVVEDDTK